VHPLYLPKHLGFSKGWPGELFQSFYPQLYVRPSTPGSGGLWSFGPSVFECQKLLLKTKSSPELSAKHAVCSPNVHSYCGHVSLSLAVLWSLFPNDPWWSIGPRLDSGCLLPAAEATWFTRSAWIHCFWDVPILTVSYLVDTCCRPGKPPYFHSGHRDLNDPRAFDVASEIKGTPFFLGGRPLAHHVEELKSLEVGLVVNMTKEWGGPEAAYAKSKIKQIRYKTLDTEAPGRETLEDGAKAVAAWLEEHAGKKVYIHCKGGHSRSS